MWDSLRNKNKGEENCAGISCSNCPFNRKVCNTEKLIFYSIEVIEIVENWAKEHPIKTNADKFREVFGVEYDPINSCIKHNVKCGNCPYYTYDGTCDVNRFWNAEYKGKTEGCEEE